MNRTVYYSSRAEFETAHPYLLVDTHTSEILKSCRTRKAAERARGEFGQTSGLEVMTRKQFEKLTA